MQLKILYIAQANYTGTLDLLVEEHRRRGNISNFVTLTKSAEGFNDGLCLNLRPNGNDLLLRKLSNLISENTNIKGEREILPGSPPFYKPSLTHKAALWLQDTIYEKHILNFIKKHDLLNYDIYHLESGMDFFKDYRILPKLKEAGKILIANYHGNDFRNRGVEPLVHKLVNANTTCEWDVHLRYPGSHYQYLPKNFDDTTPPISLPDKSKPLVLCHMVRSKNNFYYKGSEKIIAAGDKMAKENNVEFRLLYGLSHDKALEELSKCHILIEQVDGKAGYGYGMTAVEALSKGLVVAVEIQPEMKTRIGDHPFIEITGKNIVNAVTPFINDREILKRKSTEGYNWVRSTHSVKSVIDKLYELYKTL